MAKALSKSQTATVLAEKVGITKKQSVQFLDELAALSYEQAQNNFTLPGIGKLKLVNRKARMGRNPATGETIQIPAKRVVKFSVVPGEIFARSGGNRVRAAGTLHFDTGTSVHCLDAQTHLRKVCRMVRMSVAVDRGDTGDALYLVDLKIEASKVSALQTVSLGPLGDGANPVSHRQCRLWRWNFR